MKLILDFLIILNLIPQDFELAQVDVDGAHGAVHDLHQICHDLLVLVLLSLFAYAGVASNQVAFFAGRLCKAICGLPDCISNTFL